MSARVVMYSMQTCKYCKMAEQLLLARGVTNIEKIFIDKDTSKAIEMMRKTRRKTVPQIYINQTHVGGFDDLSALDREGKLIPLLQA